MEFSADSCPLRALPPVRWFDMQALTVPATMPSYHGLYFSGTTPPMNTLFYTLATMFYHSYSRVTNTRFVPEQCLLRSFAPSVTETFAYWVFYNIHMLQTHPVRRLPRKDTATLSMSCQPSALHCGKLLIWCQSPYRCLASRPTAILFRNCLSASIWRFPAYLQCFHILPPYTKVITPFLVDCCWFVCFCFFKSGWDKKFHFSAGGEPIFSTLCVGRYLSSKVHLCLPRWNSGSCYCVGLFRGLLLHPTAPCICFRASIMDCFALLF